MEKFKKGLFWFLNSFIWLAVLFFIIDIVTKNVIIANKEYILAQEGGHIVLIPGFLAISYTINTNAAFGVGVGSDLANRIVYIVLALLASFFIIAVYVKKFKKLNRLYRSTMMLILTGAIGNLIDRIFYTPEYLNSPSVGVVDWIDFYGIWKYNFNIADSCIVVGVIMLIVVLIVEEVKDRKKENATLQEINNKKAEAEKAAKEKEVK